MMTKQSTGKLPSHRVYAVTKRGAKSYWKEIGAAWAHEDGDGFSLKLDYLPLTASDLVVRKPKPNEQTDGEADPAAA